MQITYKSTRGTETGIPASRAILNGIAGDGGLYVPEQIPPLPVSLDSLTGKSYQEVAYQVMSCFLTDFTEDELRECIARAYDEKFDTPEIAPLRKTGDSIYFMELYHGATIAFKDMALSILPHLMTTAAAKNNVTDEIVILTATSGDTGKAALAGFADVPGTKIIVFYPKYGVSPVQEKQMVTQKGDNTCVIGITGNFDDAQTAVKEMFGDHKMAETIGKHGFRFSSANSINIGRLVPQIAYYVWSYVKLLERGSVKSGEEINIVVPTGNFGNILAAYYAKQMGLPVHRLICASNENKVLFDFFRTGIYDRRREFILTTSPSMDILISSNLERLVYRIGGDDPALCASRMESLRNNGYYEITEEEKERLNDFAGYYCDQDETQKAIGTIYKEEKYLIDPHTAVAFGSCRKYREKTSDIRPTVIASTASPYKFTKSVIKSLAEAIDLPEDVASFDDFTLADLLSDLSGTKIPRAVEEIRTAPVLHDKVVDAPDMPAAVYEFLGIEA